MELIGQTLGSGVVASCFECGGTLLCVWHVVFQLRSMLSWSGFLHVILKRVCKRCNAEVHKVLPHGILQMATSV